jgi:hypothetical protein
LDGNLQSTAARTVKPIKTVIGLILLFRLPFGAPQANSRSAFGTVDPLGTVGLNSDCLAAPASYPSHGKDLVLIARS